MSRSIERHPLVESRGSVADLVTRARNPHASIHEQHAAFSELIARFEGMALATALRACRNSESARDACQDAFLTAWSSLSTLREPSAFGGWIKRLVRTQCARARSRRSVSAEVSGIPGAEEVADGVDDASDQMSRHETRSLVRHIVQRLPENEREAILLFYFLSEPLIGVARALGVSVGTAGKRLYEARLRLRRALPRSIVEPFLNRPSFPSFARRVESGLLEEFVGVYRFDRRPDHSVTIRREENLLVCDAGGQRNVLTGRKPDTLAPTEFDGEGRFRRNHVGHVSHFVYYEFGRRVGVARKVTHDP